MSQEFLGALVVRILSFQCHCPGSIPGQGTETQQTMWMAPHAPTKKKKRKEKRKKERNYSMPNFGRKSKKKSIIITTINVYNENTFKMLVHFQATCRSVWGHISFVITSTKTIYCNWLNLETGGWIQHYPVNLDIKEICKQTIPFLYFSWFISILLFPFLLKNSWFIMFC